MSFGGSQGSVRYAVLVTDQATAPLQNINRQFTTFGQQMTASVTKVNAFNSAINSNSRTFTAQANAIKSTGPPLLSLQNNLKANTTQATGLGTSIKNTATKFAGLATGLSATTAGALQLAAGFRDYNDAQIAVERVTRKLSLANEAVEKTGRKVVDLQKKGQTNTKAYTDAVRDHDQALSMQQIQTQLLGEAQERLFDSQTQFVTSVVPTVLGAVGSIGFAFKDLGGANGIGGLTDKFKTLGSSLKGGLGISSITSLIGPLALAIAPLVIGLLAWESAQRKVTAVTAEFNQAKHIENITTRVEAMNKSLDKLKEPFDIPAFNFLSKLGPGGLIDPIIEKTKQMNKEFQESKSVSAQLKTAQDKYTAALKNYNDMVGFGTDAQVKAAKADLDKTKADLDGIKVLASKTKGTDDATIAVQKLDKAQKDATKSSQTFNDWALQAKAFEGTTNSINLATKAYLDVHNAIVANNPAIQKNIEQTRLQKQETDATAVALKNLNASYATPGLLAYNNSLKGATSFITTFGNRTEIAKEEMDKFNQKTSEISTGMTGFEGAIQAGVTQFQTLYDVTANNVLQQAEFRRQLIASVGAHVGVQRATAMTTEELVLNQQAIQGDTGAMKTLADQAKATAEKIKQLRDEAAQTITGGLLDMGKFFNIKAVSEQGDKFTKQLLKMLPNKVESKVEWHAKFTTKVEGMKESLSRVLKSAASLSDKDADTVGNTIIKQLNKVFGKNTEKAFPGLTEALKTAIANPDTPSALLQLLKTYDWTGAGITLPPEIQKQLDAMPVTPTVEVDPTTGAKVGADITKGINDFFGHGGGLDFGEGGGGGIVIPAPIVPAPDMSQFAGALNDAMKAASQTAKKITDSLTKISIASPDMSQYAGALNDAISAAKGAAKTITKNLTKTSIAASDMDKYAGALNDAIKAASQTAKKITSNLSKTKIAAPDLSDFAHGLNEAINAAKDAARRINAALSNTKVGGVKKAQHGMHETLESDTLIMAHKGERVDIGQGGGEGRTMSSDSRSGGGGVGGGGDTIIENHIHIMDETIMRKIQARQGRQRYTFGA